MDRLHKVLQERWCQLPVNEKEKFVEEANCNSDICYACGETDAPNSSSGRGLVEWILCYICLNWYHQKCVDKHFCDRIESFVCPLCTKSNLKGFANFQYMLRYKSPDELGKTLDIYFADWESLSAEKKTTIKDHVFLTQPMS